jgi:predicted porin
MKKSLFALAVLSAIAGLAHADTSVTIYGVLDLGIIKSTGKTTAIGRGDNNKLGFKGSEDLGGGLSALFQIEERFEPDTGTTESYPNRPLFQGSSQVGLKGDFGTIKLGRGLTPFQISLIPFELWEFSGSRGSLLSFILANYDGEPLGGPGTAKNRFSNGVFYNSPKFGGGFQFNAAVSTKENVLALGTGISSTPDTHPISLSGDYANGPFAATVAWERSAISTKVWSGAAKYAIHEWTFVGSYTQQDIDLTDVKTRGYTVGLKYKVGAGEILAAYGRNKPSNTDKTDQFSIGYEHHLSKRTFLYVDAFNRRAPGVSNVNQYDVGVHHNF